MSHGPKPHANRGFTLLELMVVVAIIAVLAIIAIPAYSNYTRKAHRSDAEQRMQQIALAQERWRAENPGYTTDWSKLGGDPDIVDAGNLGSYFDWPDVTVDNTTDPKTFSVTVNASGSQAKDSAGNVSCASLTLNSAGVRGPADCWAN